MKLTKRFAYALAATMIAGMPLSLLAAEQIGKLNVEKEVNAHADSDTTGYKALTLETTLMPIKTTDLNIPTFLVSENRAALFTNALKQTKIWRELSRGDITLFIVSDEKLEREGSAFLLEHVLVEKENVLRLRDLISYHVVLGAQLNASSLHTLSKGQYNSVSTLNNKCINIAYLGVAIKVGPEAFITESISTANGTIHYLDRLLWEEYNGKVDCSTLSVHDQPFEVGHHEFPIVQGVSGT